ncbi:expansin EXLX1 family cellulose-binding protein [Myxosarcina sp. GI1]|uniref:expansin EXLX1 family cellulose-binding protein n=1 Tax=Myxosarcina sp. GI1 TaxID=1541065 RepID=UPI000568A0D6|nr:expansin EXLX1 family cellulose-binding protein [Myxosarcina sp. GI1]
MYDVNFSVSDRWDSGFVGQMTVKNQNSSSLDNWTVEVKTPFKIKQIWDAEIISQKGNKYTIGNARWNNEIKPNGKVTFGFVGEGTPGKPQKLGVDGATFDSPSVDSSIISYSNPNLGKELKLNKNYQGRATFYDAGNPAGGKGNSGYDVPPKSELDGVAAINNVQWDGSDASGAFLKVSGPKQRNGEAKPIIVQVTDLLYERADGLDLSAQAFAKVADPVTGIVNIDYQLVGPKDNFKTPYGYTIGQGVVAEGIPDSNPWYAAVRFNNHRYPIESVKLKTDNGSLIPLQRESDNRFVLNRQNNPLYGAQDLVAEDIFGQKITLDNLNITNGSGADVITGEQFDMV